MATKTDQTTSYAVFVSPTQNTSTFRTLPISLGAGEGIGHLTVTYDNKPSNITISALGNADLSRLAINVTSPPSPFRSNAVTVTMTVASSFDNETVTLDLLLVNIQALDDNYSASEYTDITSDQVAPILIKANEVTKIAEAPPGVTLSNVSIETHEGANAAAISYRVTPRWDSTDQTYTNELWAKVTEAYSGIITYTEGHTSKSINIGFDTTAHSPILALSDWLELSFDDEAIWAIDQSITLKLRGTSGFTVKKEDFVLTNAVFVHADGLERQDENYNYYHLKVLVTDPFQEAKVELTNGRAMSTVNAPAHQYLPNDPTKLGYSFYVNQSRNFWMNDARSAPLNTVMVPETGLFPLTIPTGYSINSTPATVAIYSNLAQPNQPTVTLQHFDPTDLDSYQPWIEMHGGFKHGVVTLSGQKAGGPANEEVSIPFLTANGRISQAPGFVTLTQDISLSWSNETRTVLALFTFSVPIALVATDFETQNLTLVGTLDETPAHTHSLEFKPGDESLEVGFRLLSGVIHQPGYPHGPRLTLADTGFVTETVSDFVGYIPAADDQDNGGSDNSDNSDNSGTSGSSDNSGKDNPDPIVLTPGKQTVPGTGTGTAGSSKIPPAGAVTSFVYRKTDDPEIPVHTTHASTTGRRTLAEGHKHPGWEGQYVVPLDEPLSGKLTVCAHRLSGAGAIELDISLDKVEHIRDGAASWSPVGAPDATQANPCWFLDTPVTGLRLRAPTGVAFSFETLLLKE